MTRRERGAVVQPAIDLLIRGGASKARARAVNVPVVWPTGGGVHAGFSAACGGAGLAGVQRAGIDEIQADFSAGLRRIATGYSTNRTRVWRMAGFGRHSGIVPGIGGRE